MMTAPGACLSCGKPAAGPDELCANCRTLRVPLADLQSEELFQPASGELSKVVTAPYAINPRLVGLRRPLERLVAAFERTIGGGGAALVALEGPPGAGKSRLLVELAQAAGERARHFQAAAADPSLPFAPFVRILMARFGLTPTAGGDETRARVASLCAEILYPAHVQECSHLLAHLLGHGFPDSPVVEPLADSPQKLEARAFLAVRRFLGADAARGPIILALDDIDGAGPETVKLLHYLAGSLGAAPVLLVAAGRPGLAPPSEEEKVERIVLEPLVPDDAERLLRELTRHVAGGAVPARLVAHARRGAAVPRTLVELVRLLVEADVIVRREAGWVVDEARLEKLPLPDRPGDLIAARLALLPPAERDVLDKAAACGERFWLDALVALFRGDALMSGDPDGPTLAEIKHAGDRTRVSTALTLAKLADKGWIVEQESRVAGAREYRFAYAPLRERVAAAIEPEARRRYHRNFAQWLELRPDGRDEDAQEEIGRHLEEAGDADAAAACLRRAADAARARYFNDKAIRLYARALACVGRGNVSARIHIWHDLGSVYELKGDFEAALGAFERMLRLTWVASSRSKAAVAFNKLGRVWRRKGNLHLALEYLERGQRLFEQAGDARGVAGSLDDVGHVLHLLGRYEEARVKIAAALAQREKGGDKRSIAQSLANLGNVHRDGGRLAEARACHEQALELRREAGDRAGLAHSRAHLAAVAFARGDRDEARRGFEAALVDAERIGALPLQAQALASLGELALVEGKIEEARRRLEEALALGRELDDRRLMSEASRCLALLELTGGVSARAHELAANALTLAEEVGLREQAAKALLVLGDVHAATIYDTAEGRSPKADEFYQRAVAVYRELGNGAELARALLRQGRWRVERGDAASGKALVEEARALATKLVFKLD
jgi:tetratricopeptide (TPR) repeat protein